MLVRTTRQEYDRYVNMTCVQESNTDARTNGPCPNWSFSASPANANSIAEAGRGIEE